MKRYIYCLMMLVLLTTISCEDYLKEEPKAIAVSTYYNTAEEIETGVNAIYGSYISGGNLYDFLFPVWIDSFSDLLTGTGTFLQDYQQLSSTSLTRTSGIWGSLYLSIRNANLIIKYAPLAKDCSQEDIMRYVGEARFMRALSYFHLVRCWGGCIIRNEENMEMTDLPKSNQDEVWKLIIDDLEFAEANLPDKPSAAGRPSKWAAKTVMADAYFYLNNYTKASEKAREVIQSGKYSLVQVSSWEDFNSNLYGSDVINSTEEIFYFKFTKSGTKIQNTFVILLNDSKSPYSGGRGNAAVRIPKTSTFYKSWNDLDIRKSLLYTSGSVYLSRKFIELNILPGSASGVDFPLYRYADVLLLYAEASCRANNNPTSEGLEALNQVHRRAYGKNPTQSSDIDFKITDYNVDLFNELVLKERGYETLFEGKRWFDLKRLGYNKLKEQVKTLKGIDVNENILLLPVPTSEMDYNKSLDPTKDQNPGY